MSEKKQGKKMSEKKKEKKMSEKKEEKKGGISATIHENQRLLEIHPFFIQALIDYCCGKITFKELCDKAKENWAQFLEYLRAQRYEDKEKARYEEISTLRSRFMKELLHAEEILDQSKIRTYNKSRRFWRSVKEMIYNVK